MTGNPVTEWARCSALQQRDVDKFVAAGVELLSLVQGQGQQRRV